MKNFLKISLTTLGTLVLLGTSSIAATGTVNAPSGLVLRQEASKTSNPLATVDDKAKVEVIEESGEWYKVKYNSQEGYLFAEYVDVEEEITKPEEVTEENIEQTEQSSNSTQSNNNLKVYSMPLLTSTVIDEIQKESEITIIKQITNWTYVSSGDTQGWVRTYAISGTVVEEIPEEKTEITEQTEENQTEEPVKQEEPKQEETENTHATANEEQQEHETTVKRGTINVNSAIIRKEATKNSDVVETLTFGTSFEITAETEEWYKIKYTSVSGQVYEGYIFKDLVSI